MVMLLLRPLNDPQFTAIGEVVDLVTQILEVRDALNRHASGILSTYRGSRSCILIMLPMGESAFAMAHPIDLMNNKGYTGANIMMGAHSIYPQG